jgi:hypothetical protein
MNLQDFQNYLKGIPHIRITAFNSKSCRETIFFYECENLRMFNLDNITEFMDEMEKELEETYPGEKVYFKVNNGGVV